MKIAKLRLDGTNSGKLKSLPLTDENNYIQIRRGRFIEDSLSHPLFDENFKYFKRVYCLENEKKYIYCFNRFGNDGKNGFHIGMNWFQHQQFLWMQNRHWIQKESNFRYLVNLFFLVFGVYISLKSLK